MLGKHKRLNSGAKLFVPFKVSLDWQSFNFKFEKQKHYYATLNSQKLYNSINRIDLPILNQINQLNQHSRPRPRVMDNEPKPFATVEIHERCFQLK